MALIGRVFVILFAIFVAMLAAGVALSFGILGGQWQSVSGDVGERFVFWWLAIVASGVTATIALTPLAIAVVVAEAFSLRSFLLHVVLGAVILPAAYLGAGLGTTGEESIDRPPSPISREVQLAAVAGMVFGAAYWLIAGRNAGRWRGGY